MSKITLKITNRLESPEAVPNATVTAGRPSPVQPGDPILVNKVTNASGRAEFNSGELPDGKYAFTIVPKDSWVGPVGPGVAAGNPPNRIFRTLQLDVEIRAGIVLSAKLTAGNELNGTVSVAAGTEIRVALQPVWMKSTAHNNRGAAIDMIVVHHTDCNTQRAVDTFLVEKGPHYMIDVDGQIVKFVQEAQASWHAGPSFWAGQRSLNANSIGIEIVNIHDPYPEVQYKSLLELLDSLLSANPGIDAWNIVGHSDVSLGDDGVLGRKSGDPGPKFEWNRLEQKNWGLLQGAGAWSADNYGGFFTLSPGGSLRRNDNDAAQRWGGHLIKPAPGAAPAISGKPVKELQNDLKAIGYFVATPDGDYGLTTFAAVRAFQEHFFAGGRGPKDPDGQTDLATARLIKSVAGARPT